MGPLGSLWLTLEEVRTGKSDANVDLFECLKLVEQSITLIGQAKVSLTYERRLAILYRLTGDVKKAKKLHLASMNLRCLIPTKLFLAINFTRPYVKQEN